MTSQPRGALITGASAGIGEAFARHLAAEGYDLLLVARREERLRTLAGFLQQQHGVRCEILAADLSDPASPRQVVSYAQAQDFPIDVLINNAGLSGKAKFADTSWEHLSTELQVMIGAVTELAHAVIPQMRDRGWGRIINLSSIAALQAPGASLLYTAIKSYVLNMSQSLDMELKPLGINVTALCPGLTYSEFHDVMGIDRNHDLARAELYSRLGQVRRCGFKDTGAAQSAHEVVVAQGWDAAMKGKAVCVPGLLNKILCGAARPIPLRVQYEMGRTLNPFKNA